MAAASAIDGRSARSERTRAALARAYLDLLTEGDLRPTAERIAARAEVSPRSVFKHFPDREDLFAEASRIQETRIRELVEDPPDPAAPLAERIDRFVAQRSEMCEFVAPVRRAALLSEPFSAVIAERLTFARQFAADQVAACFAAELKGHEDLLPALVTAASWSTWESLRTHQGLSHELARRTMRAMLVALLENNR
jgi:AcrR family transcriptional regulator